MAAGLEKTTYKCPVCNGMLTRTTSQYVCTNKHSFDIAKEGYVNLLYPAKRSREQGDNKEMVLARRRFLHRGHYRRLSDELAKIAGDVAMGRAITLVDSGCGEGYYLKNTVAVLHNQKTVTIEAYGFDISKSAIKLAAKENPGINFAVANVFKLPVPDKSVAIVESVFSPFNEEEVYRIARDRGYWIIVTPGRHHLFELKSKLYDKVELNDGSLQLRRFKIISKAALNYQIDIQDNETVRDLIKMTPYYWKTGRDKIESALNDLTALQSRVAFDITICRK